jgi:hypothetical protein
VLDVVSPIARRGLRGAVALLALVATAVVPDGVQAQLPSDGSAAAAGRTYPIDPETAPRPMLRAARAARPPSVDGRLDEAAWAAADSADDFVQQLPHTGMPARFRTVVRVLYDADFLYVGAMNYDPEPGRAITAGLERDFVSTNSDAIGIGLDTFHDRRNSFLFIVNPKGAVRDEQTFDDSRTVVEAWEGVVEVKTAVVRTAAGDSAWVAEMAIPLRTLRFDAHRPVQEWGINFVRRVRRVNETSYWAPLERQYRVHRMSKAGTLTGLEGLRQGRNLQLKPYAVTSRSAGAQVPATAHGAHADAGLDAKYGLTPSLTLDATYNTDFSQVEVDQEQVNLTRFSLFFPERREFFIENAGAFTFGDVEERGYRMGASLRDFTLFNSRRIGLTRDGRPTPIIGGGRLSGRVGDWNIGLLDMHTRAALAEPGEHFVVGRARRNVLGNSDVGLLLSSREGGGAYNRSYGVDANVRPTANLVANAYVAASDASGTSADGYTTRTSLGYRGKLWNSSVMAKRVSEDFDPGLGFVRRRAIQQWFGTTGAHARPPLRGVQEVNPYVTADYITDLDGQLETRTLQAGLELYFQPDGQLSLEARDQFDRLDEAFTVFPGRQVPPGGYAWREATVRYQTGQGRPLSGSVSATGGGFYDGVRRSAGGSVVWRARYDLAFEGAVQRNDVDRAAGDFTADLASLRVRYAWSTRLFGSAFVQYNTQARAFVTNARVSLRYGPLSDVFLVYTERHATDTGVRNERSVALKMTRMAAL